jgi:glycosyltransferase involved in cell wall biosynthesis
MRLCLVADMRSPIAKQWVGYFRRTDVELTIVSTHAVSDASGTEELLYIGNGGRRTGLGRARSLSRWPGTTIATSLRDNPASFWGKATFGAQSIMKLAHAPRLSNRLAEIVEAADADLVHAMRIPFEAIIAARKRSKAALAVSIWGNDLTLYASRSPTYAAATARTLRSADGLLADTTRDIRLARAWGWPRGKPSLVIPGNGGVDLELFAPGAPRPDLRGMLGIGCNAPVVVAPRGVRRYVNTSVLFEAASLVVDEEPATVFVVPATAGNEVVGRLVQRYHVEESVRLLPTLPPVEMAEIFRLATTTVSLTRHDGTPNTMLEAMACGCFPVVGNLSSVREWITSDKNGLLVDPADPVSVSQAILRSLRDDELVERAAVMNRSLIADRADYRAGMIRVESFYERVLDGKTPSGFHEAKC